MGTPKKAFVNTHIEMTFGSINIDDFLHATTPKGTLNIPKTKAWNAQGQPDNVITSSTVEWSDIVATKLHTDQSFKPLWDEFKKAIDDPNSAKQQMTITEKTKDGKVLATWNLKGAIIKGVETSDMDANGHEIKKLTVHVTYDDCELK